MNARRLALAAAAVVVLIGGVVAAVLASSDRDTDVARQAAPSTTAPPATTTTTMAPTFPLTGLPAADPAAASRPALVVKVDNTAKASGRQAGLNSADLVYVEMVEGGATRLAAVFHSTAIDAVGPVRSARTTDVALTANLNRPVFAYSGANQGVLDRVRGANLVDAGFDVRPGGYQVRGSGVLRFFIATPTFFGFADADAGPPTPLYSYRDPGEAVTAPSAEGASGVQLSYGGVANVQVSYDATANGWARSQNGSAFVEDSGTRIEPANVVIQFVDYGSSGFVDVTGAPSPEAALVGEGEVWVFTGGKLIRGRWSRPDLGVGTAYTDGAGNLIELTPGRTWVELAPPGSAAVR